MITYSLNLDPDFKPFKKTIEVEKTILIFSGGEVHIVLDTRQNIPKGATVVITARPSAMSHVMLILLAKNALNLRGVRNVKLFMPYTPYARQDRKCYEGESFSLLVFSQILNQAAFEEVTVLDAHSDVAPALIRNSENLSNYPYVEEVIRLIGNPKLFLISPDAGANKKSNYLAQKLQLPLVKCDKQRNTKDGSLSGFEVFAEDLKGQDCLIVDDICDGGGTFVGLAKELKKKNAGKLYLFVTHGIFSRGFSTLKENFEGIFSTDSFSTIEDENLTQIKINIV